MKNHLFKFAKYHLHNQANANTRHGGLLYSQPYSAQDTITGLPADVSRSQVSQLASLCTEVAGLRSQVRPRARS